MRTAVLAAVLLTLPVAAQTIAPPPDTPSIKVGVLLLADYTYTASVAPPARDADGNVIHPSSFNVSRRRLLSDTIRALSTEVPSAIPPASP